MPYIQRFSVVIAVGRSTLLNGASVTCIRDDTCRLPALCSGGRRRDESVANTHAPCSALIDDACRLVTAAVNHVICKRGESPSNTRDPATINSVIVKTTARHGGLGEGCSAEDIELAHISLVTVASVNIISATQPHIWCVIQSGAGVAYRWCHVNSLLRHQIVQRKTTSWHHAITITVIIIITTTTISSNKAKTAAWRQSIQSALRKNSL